MDGGDNMIIEVNEEIFWRLTQESYFYYREDEVYVYLYAPREGHFVCAKHLREDSVEQESEMNEYLIYKQEKLLDRGISIIGFEDKKIDLVLRQE